MISGASNHSLPTKVIAFASVLLEDLHQQEIKERREKARKVESQTTFLQINLSPNLENPKSQSLQVLVASSTRAFSVFTSRWIILVLWRYSKDIANWMANFVLCSQLGLKRARCSRRLRPYEAKREEGRRESKGKVNPGSEGQEEWEKKKQETEARGDFTLTNSATRQRSVPSFEVPKNPTM